MDHSGRARFSFKSGARFMIDRKGNLSSKRNIRPSGSGSIIQKSYLNNFTNNQNTLIGDGSYGTKCFVAGTLVQTADGYRSIELLRCGDLVVTLTESGKSTASSRIVEINSHQARLLELVLKSEDGTKESISTTLRHPFLVEGLGFVKAGELQNGMQISVFCSSKSKLAGSATVESVDSTGKKDKVLNLITESGETYFVGKSGACVRNVALESSADLAVFFINRAQRFSFPYYPDFR
jgi:hypothetical protein